MRVWAIRGVRVIMGMRAIWRAVRMWVTAVVSVVSFVTVMRMIVMTMTVMSMVMMMIIIS